jgi:protein-tyrosine phosphatase
MAGGNFKSTGSGMVDFDFVTDRIATGAALSSPADVDQLIAAGINVVVDARAEFDDGPLFAGKNIAYLWNPTEDDGVWKPPAYWQKTLEFVMPLLAQPRQKVYLHCQAGRNRGPSNAFCVMVAQGIPADTAAQMIVTARPVATLAYKADALAACQLLGYV